MLRILGCAIDCLKSVHSFSCLQQIKPSDVVPVGAVRDALGISPDVDKEVTEECLIEGESSLDVPADIQTSQVTS